MDQKNKKLQVENLKNLHLLRDIDKDINIYGLSFENDNDSLIPKIDIQKEENNFLNQVVKNTHLQNTKKKLNFCYFFCYLLRANLQKKKIYLCKFVAYLIIKV